MNLLISIIAVALASQTVPANRFGTTEPELAQPAASSPAAVPAAAAEIKVTPDASAGTPRLDSSTQSAPNTTQPVAEPQKSVLLAGPKPSDLMRLLLKAPPKNQLSGVSITLSDAVRDAKTRQDQTQRAKAYWDLSAAVADYYLAQLEEMELAVLRQGLKAPGKTWDVRQQEALARVETTERSTQAAQLRLHQLLGRPSNAALPLPGDAPHCGRYNAEYDEIFASRPDPIAEQLSRLMPLRYNDLRSQAQSVADAETWRASIRQRIDPNAEGNELLQAQDLLALRRRAFVATARDYNQDIAAYTELAAPKDVPADRLVAMMIRTSAQNGQAPWTPSGVDQASATEPVDQSPQNPGASAAAGSSQEPNGVPQTFARGTREVRHPGPLQRLFNRDREHSILINRPHILRRVLGNE